MSVLSSCGANPRVRARTLLIALFLTAFGTASSFADPLDRFNPATTDPDLFRLAVRHPDRMKVPDGAATVHVVLSDKETGRVVQEKRIELQRTTTGEQAAEVRAEAPENVVTVYRIPAKQVAELRALQAKYLAMPQSRQQSIGGSLSIDVTGCKLDAADTGEMLISTYLKTSELETFVALAENFDLRNTQASSRNDLENSIPPCS
ncbi:hypothetical protein [Roseibium aggregatum]|uniref:hypothetical protein n=1 Tax=Roseibium aggregatum TaxID=187304 RepID=UPI001E4427E9|nr:hypothetical protein [Roseibium aggregatum]UES48230.1 hypothetical protein GFK88_00500 [Roseibium aggregatum]